MSDVINTTEKESAVKKTSDTAAKRKAQLKKKNQLKRKAQLKKKMIQKPAAKKTSAKGNKVQSNKNMNFMEKLDFIKNPKLLLGIVALVILVIVLGMSSCGVNHNSPKKVVKSLIESYSDGKAKKALKCFGSAKEASEDLKKEVEATIKYFDVHNAENVQIEECDILSENDNYAYVYIIYDFVMEDEQIYPNISTYMVKNEDGKYYVVSPAEVTAEMSEQAIVDYEKFMTTDIYKTYMQEYETFTKKNPGYENKIAGKLS